MHILLYKVSNIETLNIFYLYFAVDLFNVLKYDLSGSSFLESANNKRKIVIFIARVVLISKEGGSPRKGF